MFSGSLKDAWEVLLLFIIPIGGGIPAGVLLARAKGFDWPMMTVLYFVSDVILALAFEPLMKLFIAIGQRTELLRRFSLAFKKAVDRSTAHYGSGRGPIALVLIAFGTDPMTGRAAAVAAGHGFVTGWAIAIIGDMFFFALLMASTLWLSNVLGDGTLTTVIILGLMIVIPSLVRRIRRPRLENQTP